MHCKLLFHAVHVASVTCVDLYEVALIDEQWHANLGTSLEGGGLGGVGCSVALDSWLAMGDAQVGLHWHLGIEDSIGVSIADNFYHVTLFHEVNTCDEVLGDGYLVEGLLVHEDVVCSVEIEVLVWTTLYAYIFESLTDIKALLEYAAADHVLECGTHDGVTFSWLYVQEVDAEIELAIHTDACAFLDVL